MTIGAAVAARAAGTLEQLARQLRSDELTSSDLQRVVAQLSAEAQLLALLAKSERKLDGARLEA